MVYLPVKKCFHVAKVIFVGIVVVTVLAAVEKWRGGKRTARAAENPQEAEWERQILEDELRVIPGLGEGGVAATLSGRDKELGEQSEKRLAINVHLSDRIAYNRSLNDHRNPACDRVVYDAELPSASVVIIFHNEPYSVVLRTVWSVLTSARRDRPWYKRANYVDRDTGRTMNLGYPGQDPDSPFVYLKEIILVDDNSTLPELKGKLSHYVRTRLPPDLIRILRLPDRRGVTGARYAGSQLAVADVIVFLDAQCEANVDWLRPLLQRIKDKKDAVVTPLIDMLSGKTLEYEGGNKNDFEGLMLARISGARVARGAVLVFLDAHCEAQRDWLRPLLQRHKQKRDAVLTPLIDVIDQSTFKLEAASDFQVGGFTFMGHFTWIDVPEREKQRRGSDIAPTWSPTMAGGLFAIGRSYYWELGAYDEQMAGWGGENLEMSFRIWQCGGTLETIPCSRVGHVFRSFHPYAMPANSDTHGINTARMAEVWMDDYKELFYLHRPDLRKNPKIGDVTHRKVLREKLQCKSFEWYLQHVYKEKFVPVRDAFGYGRFRNAASGLCLDTLQRENDAAPLGVYPCHDTLQGTQYLSLALDGQLRDEERCAQLQHVRELDDDGQAGRRLLMFQCSRKAHGQKFRYTTQKQLLHISSGLCVDAGFEGGADVLAKTCRSDAPSQRWDIDYSEHNGFKRPDEVEPSEAELTLQKLRGQRRISRSLLSYNEDGATTGPGAGAQVGAGVNVGVRRHTHRRRKHQRTKKHSKAKRSRSKSKNKFILKLVRTLMNNSEEHLEVDVHCRHTRLYPNNSFVRDLVTILNEKNIKVINNGRVFERNRVTELGHTALRHKEQKVLEKMPVERAPPQEKVEAQPQPQHVQTPSAVATQWSPGGMGGNTAGGNTGGGSAGGGTGGGNKKRRLKSARTLLTPPAVPPVQIPSGVNSVSEANSVQNDNKIIIEDFVEVRPPPPDVPTQQQRAHNSSKKKRKHLRRPPPPSPAAPPPPPAVQAPPTDQQPISESRKRPREHTADYDDEKVENVPAPTSLEEVPLVSAELPVESAVTVAATKRRESESSRLIESDTPDEDDNDNDNEVYGNYQMRRQQGSADIDAMDTLNNTTENSGSAPNSSSDTGQGPNSGGLNRASFRSLGSGRPPSPLKVVMKSNLTFNLGDEFFTWRAKDDVADLLGSLAIPSNGSLAPPLHAWVRPPLPQPPSPPVRRLPISPLPRASLRDNILTAHGAHSIPTDAEDDSSSSSESGDNEQ